MTFPFFLGLGLACPTVMLGVIDENSEKVLSCETAQKITQDSGYLHLFLSF